MSSKQDRQGVRTAADVERKYLLDLETRFAELMGISLDIRANVVEEVSRLDTKIKETSKGILLSVSETYATNASVETRIELSRNEILLTVSGTYATNEALTAINAKVNANGASIESQAKLIEGNTTSIASLGQEVDANSANIKSQAELIEGNAASIASISQTVDLQGTSIESQAKLIKDNAISIASVSQTVDSQGTSINSQAKLIEDNTISIASISQTVDLQGTSIESQAKLIADNTIGIAAIDQAVSSQEASINSQARLIADNSDSIASIRQTVDEQGASIESQTKLINDNTVSIASVSQAAGKNSASIGLFVENGMVKGGVLIEAINDETSAKISADRLDIEGKTLNIKVAATNITGALTIGQLPSSVATTSDIPTSTSELYNDSGYQTRSGVVSIIDGRITADFIEALNITVDAAQINGTLEVSGSAVVKALETYKVTLQSASIHIGDTYGTYYGEGSCGSAKTRIYWGTSSGSVGGSFSGSWSFPSSTSTTSDASLKNTINDMDGRYDVFFDSLRPVTYKYNDGTSGRFHTGYIANEVVSSLASAGLTTQDFAGYVLRTEIAEDGEETQIACLRYDEFVAVNTWQIQKLKARVEALEEYISNMTV